MRILLTLGSITLAAVNRRLAAIRVDDLEARMYHLLNSREEADADLLASIVMMTFDAGRIRPWEFAAIAAIAGVSLLLVATDQNSQE